MVPGTYVDFDFTQYRRYVLNIAHVSSFDRPLQAAGELGI